MDFKKILERIEGSEFDDGYIIEQLIADIGSLGAERAASYLFRFSPSKLGRLGYLGLRKLAKIRRDHPEKFRELIK